MACSGRGFFFFATFANFDTSEGLAERYISASSSVIVADVRHSFPIFIAYLDFKMYFLCLFIWHKISIAASFMQLSQSVFGMFFPKREK